MNTSPTGNPLERYLGYQLRRATAVMQADLNRRIAEFGVTIVEMSTLLVIEENPLITQSEIGRMLSIKSANMAPLAGGLVQLGLIERLPADGRSHGLRLTITGENLAAELHSAVDANEAMIVSRLSIAERSQTARLLHLMWSGER